MAEIVDIIDTHVFIKYMEKLFARFDETDNKIQRLATQQELEKIKVLDNQDLCLMLRVHPRTLQRYRMEGLIKYFKVKGKNYYKLSDVKKFLAER